MIEQLSQISETDLLSNQFKGHLILERSIQADEGPEGMFKGVAETGSIIVTDNYLGDTDIIVPSLDVVSHLGHEASIVDLHASNSTLAKLYADTVKLKHDSGKSIREMLFGMVVRVLDTPGGQGLHHIHKSVFPNPVFHTAKNSHGGTANVYMTAIGQREDGYPIYGLVTATPGKREEYKFFRYINAGNQKKGYNP